MSGRRSSAKDFRRRLFDPEASINFAERVFQEAGIGLAVIGRFAIWGWVDDESQHSMTKDFDVAVARVDMPFLESWIEEQSLPVRHLSIGGLNVKHANSGVNIDFIDRSSKQWGDLSALYSEAIKEALDQGEVFQFGDVELPLVPPEHLVVMKIATLERDDELDASRLLESPTAEVAVETVRDLFLNLSACL